MLKLLSGIIAVLLVGLLGGLFFVRSGAFNVAATNPDSAMTEWILSTTMRRSVVMRSSDIEPPKSFTDEQVRDGFEEFNEMCVGCHGAPGKQRSDIGKGLRPLAPNLAEAARRWNNGNLFWIVKNGINMTGMPAFGPTHDDAMIWNIVAFVSRLPEMTPEQYGQLEEQTAGSAPKHQH